LAQIPKGLNHRKFSKKVTPCCNVKKFLTQEFNIQKPKKKKFLKEINPSELNNEIPGRRFFGFLFSKLKGEKYMVR